MTPVAWLDEVGKPAWIALTIVSFFLWWPLGLVVLGYLVGSGRMFGCWNSRGGGEWRSRIREQAAGWCGPRAGGGMRAGMRGSGNRAFDDYREETLRRLEEEEREFKEFLDRLRQAKDKAEFDQFMAEMRGRRPTEGGPSPQPQG
jgi:Protein of unknown function (DUF2852)